MVDLFLSALYGFVWVGSLSINTRIVAHRTDFLPTATYNFIVSVIYLLIIRHIVLAETFLEMAGYPVGTAIAAGLVTRYFPRPQSSSIPRPCATLTSREDVHGNQKSPDR